MNGHDGKPTKPDDDFEPLAPALEKHFGKKFARLPAKLRKWITHDRYAVWLPIWWNRTTPGGRRNMAQDRDWAADPANNERDFLWDVDARYSDLERKERELMVVPAVGAQAVAARNHEQRLINAERIALQRDQAEVESADPGERRATIERIRRRWDERVLRSAGVSIMEQTQGVAGPLRAPAGVDAHPEKGKTSKGGGGRPLKYDWSPVDIALLERLSENGAPAKGDGGQAELERFVANLFPPDGCPTESVIKERVRRTIEDFRRRLD